MLIKYPYVINNCKVCPLIDTRWPRLANIFLITQGIIRMKKILTFAIVMFGLTGLTACFHVGDAAAAEGLPQLFDPSGSISYERAFEADSQTIKGSLNVGPVEFGTSFTDDLAVTGIQFDINSYDVNFSQPIGENVSFYANNEFDTDFAHTETTLGISLSF